MEIGHVGINALFEWQEGLLTSKKTSISCY